MTHGETDDMALHPMVLLGSSSKKVDPINWSERASSFFLVVHQYRPLIARQTV